MSWYLYKNFTYRNFENENLEQVNQNDYIQGYIVTYECYKSSLFIQLMINV